MQLAERTFLLALFCLRERRAGFFDKAVVSSTRLFAAFDADASTSGAPALTEEALGRVLAADEIAPISFVFKDCFV